MHGTIHLTFIALFALTAMGLWVFAFAIAKRIVPEGLSIDASSAHDLSCPVYQLAFVICHRGQWECPL